MGELGGTQARPRGWRLRSHLLLLAAVVTLPLVAGAAAAGWVAFVAYRQGFEDKLEGHAEAQALVVAAEIDRLLPVLAALGDVPIIGQASGPEEWADFYSRARRHAESLGTSFVVRRTLPDLALAFDTALPFGWHGASELHPVVREAAQRALESGRPVLSDLATDGEDGRPAAVLWRPIVREGTAIAVMGAVVDPGRLAARLAAHAEGRDFTLVVIDSRGRFVARSADHDSMVGRTVRSAYFNRAIELPRGLGRGPDFYGQPSTGAFRRVPGFPSWVVLAFAPDTAFDATWRRPFWLVLTGFAAALALALVGAAAVSRHLLRRPEPFGHVGAGHPVSAASTWLPAIQEFEEARERLDEAHAKRRAEAARADGERALLRSVIDSSGDAIFVKDLEGKYVLANETAARALGRALPDVVGHTDAEIWPAVAERNRAGDRAAIEAGRLTVSEDACPDPGGGPPRIFLTAKAPWLDGPSGRILGVVGIAHDITDWRTAEGRLRSAEAALQRLARRTTVAAMASGLAHELNQPLGAAAAYFGAAERMLAAQPGADPARQACGRAAAQVVRAGDILRRLRDFVGGAEQVRHNEDVVAVIREGVALALAGGAPECDVDVAWCVQGPVGEAAVDRVQIQQVVVNLMRNAMEAMAPNPIEERLVEIRLAGSADEVEVCVADSGPGLSGAVEADPFSPLRSEKPGGLGVGLSICRAIVEAHGGRIWAERREPRGARFRFTLAREAAAGMRVEDAA
jgi:two-component system sensor kinase FixL